MRHRLMVDPSSFARPGAAASSSPRGARPAAHGRFLFQDEEKLYVRAVTYGTFRPGPDGSDYPAPEVVARDLNTPAALGPSTRPKRLSAKLIAASTCHGMP